MTRYRFVEAESGRYSVAQLCRIAKVSRTAYYEWQGRSVSERARVDAELTAKIRAIHAASGGQYGVPRVLAELRAQGYHVGRKRVARLMKAAGLRALRPPPRLQQPAREVRALAQLGDRQVDRPEPRVPRPCAVPVAGVHALRRALAVPRAAQGIHLHRHQLLTASVRISRNTSGAALSSTLCSTSTPAILSSAIASSPPSSRWATSSKEGAAMAFAYRAAATGPRTPRRRTLTVGSGCDVRELEVRPHPRRCSGIVMELLPTFEG
jgi:transposase InsO family protein